MTRRSTITKVKSPKPVAIDLFSGCGGLSAGLRKAGFGVAAAVELDAKAQATYVLNHPSVKLYKADIRSLCPDQMLRDLGLERGQVALLAGCPPCQGFSRLRTRNKSTSVYDPRNDLVKDFLRFVVALWPKTVMMENVPALARDEGFGELQSSLVEMGYSVVVEVLDAADYGVAQRRKRLIMLASRVHVPSVARRSAKRITVKDAFRGIGSPSKSKDDLHALPERRSAAVRKIISLIPKNGGSRKDLPAKYQLDCHKRSDGFSDVYGRMSWGGVAPTMTSGCCNPSKGRFLHPSQDRNISLREAALLQGFPMNYCFDVSHGKEAIALMIGNALPPPFIAAHARGLLRAVRLQETTSL